MADCWRGLCIQPSAASAFLPPPRRCLRRRAGFPVHVANVGTIRKRQPISGSHRMSHPYAISTPTGWLRFTGSLSPLSGAHIRDMDWLPSLLHE